MFGRWASLYRDRRLPGRARTAVERHLTICGQCAQRYEGFVIALHEANVAPMAGGLIPADVTHQLPNPDPRRRVRRTLVSFALWLLGLAVLVGLLATAYVAGYRRAVDEVRAQDPPAATARP